MNLNIYTRKYVKLTTLETQDGLALVAFLIVEEGGEVVSISEPRIVKILRKNIALPGEISTAFLLPAPRLKPILKEVISSPYADYFNFKNLEFSVYSPRAPTDSAY